MIPCAVWYPTDSPESPYTYGSGVGGSIQGSVAPDAPARPGSWPLVVFSHGFSGGGVGQTTITESLARSGYVVAAPDHSDPILCVRIAGTATGTLEGALDYLDSHPFGSNGALYSYRIPEIQAVVSALYTNTRFHVLPNKIALAGHSMGAWTVMSVMTNGFNPDAMILYSMGELNWLFTAQRYFQASVFQAMSFPTIYFYGSRELSSAMNAGRTNVYAAYAYHHSPSPSYGVEIAGGNHFVYNNFPVASEGSAGTPSQFEAIQLSSGQFLDRHLKNLSTAVTCKVSK